MKKPERGRSDRRATAVRKLRPRARPVPAERAKEQALKDLRQTERDFRALAENAGEALVVCLADGGLLFANRRAAELSGYSVPELLTLNLRQLVRSANLRRLHLRPRPGRPLQAPLVQSETTLITKRGRSVSVELVASRTLWRRRPASVVALRDRSQQTEVLQVLRESEERLRGIFENASLGLYRTTPDGQILMANPALLRMLGYASADELSRRNLEADGYEPRYPRSVFKELIEREGQVVGLESAWVRRDQAPLYIRESAKAIRDPAGKTLYYEGSVEDISERKRAEDELSKSREELQRLTTHLERVREEESTRMAGRVHDELGQALTVLRMDLAWLKKKLPDDSRPLVEKAEAMVRLIDETVEKVQTIAQELRPGILDDLGLEAAIEWQVREFEKRTGIPCALRLETRGFIPNRGTSTAIFRILQEALLNVARHAQARAVRVLLAERDSSLVLTVQDDGRGIAAAQFNRPDAFGLTQMRERARRLGGTLKIEGTPGQGTTVEAAIPIPKRSALHD